MRTITAMERLAAAAAAVAVTLALLAGVSRLANQYAQAALEDWVTAGSRRDASVRSDAASRGNTASLRCIPERDRSG